MEKLDVGALLGSGMFGEVYAAKWHGTPVAVKRMHPHLRQLEGRATAFRKRYCVLFSSSRLLYFTDASCTHCHGAVDLAVATNVEAVHTAKGPGFEVATAGRTWRFAPPVEASRRPSFVYLAITCLVACPGASLILV